MTNAIIAERLSSDRVGSAHAFLLALIDELYPPAAARSAFANTWSPQRLRQAIDQEDVPILVVPDPAGPISGLLIGTPPEGGVSTVIWLGVTAGIRSKGIGRRLMQDMETHCRSRGGHKVKLFCNTEAAKGFYERCGYVAEGFHPNHWWRMDAWSMGRLLEE